MSRLFLKVIKCPAFLTKPVNLVFSAEVSGLFLVFEALFDFHGRSDLFHTPQPGQPAVPQPPVPVRPYQADKNLCLLPRNPGPGGCGGDRSFLSGLIYSLPSSREDKPRPARWASRRGLSAAPKRLQPPPASTYTSIILIRLTAQLTWRTQAKQNCKMADIWGNYNDKVDVSSEIRGNSFKRLVFNKLHSTHI